jgi:hypothetical protein
MKSLLTVVVAVLMILSFSMVGFAQSAMTGSQTTVTEKKMGSEHHKTYNGKVVSFDMASHMLVVEGMITKKTFDVSNAIINGTLQPGQKVVVTYYSENGKMVASSVSGESTAMYHGTDTTTAHGKDMYHGTDTTTGNHGGY